MKEEYLHAVWRMKRLPVSQLYLTDGRKLTIKNTGWHNHDAGPDFFNGSIEIDGIKWNGNIEIHIKSSDWYAHKHHLDQAYNSVILHVVFEHDRDVLIHEQKIPTLELKSLIDFNHWSLYRNLVLSQQWIPCESSIHQVEKLTVKNQVESSLLERLNRKNEEIKKMFKLLGNNQTKLFYEIYARAFGLKVNSLPFIELTKKLDVKLLWKENKCYATSLMLGVAGMFQEKSRFGFENLENNWRFLEAKHKLSEMNFHSWKFKGLRPPSFPNKRIEQFARLCSNQDFFNMNNSDLEFILTSLDALNFPLNFKNNLIINAFVPIFWWNYSHFQNEDMKEKALDLLAKTKAESNSIIQNWKNLGLKSKSSFDTQGLLELKNELCAKKKCLTCKIGFAVLKQ